MSKPAVAMTQMTPWARLRADVIDALADNILHKEADPPSTDEDGIADLLRRIKAVVREHEGASSAAAEEER